jgi:hypothetical protein
MQPSIAEKNSVTDLFVFFEDHVTAHNRVEFAKLQTLGGVSLVFDGVVDKAAFGAFHTNLDAIAFFGHDATPLELLFLKERRSSSSNQRGFASNKECLFTIRGQPLQPSVEDSKDFLRQKESP